MDALPAWIDCCHCEARILPSGRRVTATWIRAGSMSSTSRRIASSCEWARNSLLKISRGSVARWMLRTSSSHSRIGGGLPSSDSGDLSPAIARAALSE